MSDTFVDFKEVKERVSISMVLDHYKISVRKINQHSLRGRCPLPSHTSDKSKESFIVQTEKNIWTCQSASCVAGRNGKKGGNILDLVALMSNSSIRDAALKLRDLFMVATNTTSASDKKEERLSPEKPTVGNVEQADEGANKPLTFALKEVDHAHTYFRQRGIQEDTAKTFGVGFFSGRGSMSGRVVIPIHNERGELVAYAGRSIDSAEPKYKLPAGFAKSVELFNLHRVLALPEKDRGQVVVCEGFFDSMKVHQAGVAAVVGLMGSSLSDAQEKLLRQFGRVILFLDGDEAGREASRVIAARLTHGTFVKIVDVADGKQPDQLSSAEIKKILSGC